MLCFNYRSCSVINLLSAKLSQDRSVSKNIDSRSFFVESPGCSFFHYGRCAQLTRSEAPQRSLANLDLAFFCGELVAIVNKIKKPNNKNSLTHFFDMMQQVTAGLAQQWDVFWEHICNNGLVKTRFRQAATLIPQEDVKHTLINNAGFFISTDK